MRGHGYASMVVPAVSAEELEFDTNDGAIIDPPSRALWVGTGGDVVGTLATDTVPTVFSNVQDGTLLPFSFKSLASIAGGTTAENLVVLR